MPSIPARDARLFFGVMVADLLQLPLSKWNRRGRCLLWTPPVQDLVEA